MRARSKVIPVTARFLPALVVAAWATWAWRALGPYPPGFDAGNWLLLGLKWFVAIDDPIEYSPLVYPPLVPVALFLGSLVLGAPLAAKILAVGSATAVLCAVAWIGRFELSSPAVALALVVAGSSLTILEPMAYGGYPQNTAIAAMLVGVHALTRRLALGDPRASRTAVAAFLVVGLAHHAYMLITAAVAVTAAVLAAWTARREGRRPSIVGALSTLAPGSVAFALTALALADAGYRPPINSDPFAYAEGLRHVFRDPHAFWLGVGVLGAAGLAVSLRAPTTLSLTATSLGLVGSGAYLVRPEARVLPLVFLASVLGASLLIDRSARRIPALVLSALVVASILPASARHGEGVATWYRCLDGEYLRLAEWARSAGRGLTIAVGADRRKLPIGWWLPGLSRARVIAESDPRWLAFERQVAYSESIASVLDERSGAGAAMNRARNSGIDFVVVSKPDFAPWQAWSFEPGIRVAFETPRFIVFDAREAR